jgi:hypothetical protein
MATPHRSVPSTPPSAWQQQPKTFDFPPQPYSLAGVLPECSLPFQQPPEPYYCTPMHQYQPQYSTPPASGYNDPYRKTASKSLPSSPVKRSRPPPPSGYATTGSSSEESPHHMTRTTSFPDQPHRRTRTLQGNIYMSVNKSEPHICEKETVL